MGQFGTNQDITLYVSMIETATLYLIDQTWPNSFYYQQITLRLYYLRNLMPEFLSKDFFKEV